MTNTTKSLLDERDRFISYFAYPPTRLYVGNFEYNAMRQEAEPWLSEPADSKRRFLWNGIPVFRVDADRHLEFGSQLPSPCA